MIRSSGCSTSTLNSYLPGDLLPKIDIATMAHSLEARSPFLDHELMEFAASLPGSAKLNGASGKAILKTAFRGILPDEVLESPIDSGELVA